jgi:hypothetical protein
VPPPRRSPADTDDDLAEVASRFEVSVGLARLVEDRKARSITGRMRAAATKRLRPSSTVRLPTAMNGRTLDGSSCAMDATSGLSS